MTDQGLKRRTAINLSFNAVAKIVMVGLQAVANIILTRTLAPGDYGLVGMAIIFMNFFNLFGDLGIANAVIRKEELTERDLYTGFTVRVGQGILLVALCGAAAPLASRLFANPEVGKILAVFSLNFVINSIGFLPYVQLNRELRYDRLFIPQVGYALAGSVTAIILALMGFRHWSLVLGTLGSSVAFVILLNIMKPTAPRFCCDGGTARHFFSYGMNIFLVGFVSYALLNAGNFVIGAVDGPTQLGYYTIAFNWGGMICTLLIGTVSTVLFPTFATIQNDRERLRAAYLKIIEFIALIAGLANLTLLLTGREFLYLILGHSSDKWFPSLVALQILCVYGVLKGLLEPGSSLMMAIGNTRVPFRATLAAAVVQVGLLYPALRFGGIEGVALLIVLATMVQYGVYLPAMKRHLGLRLRDLFSQVRMTLVALAFTAAVVLTGKSWFEVTTVAGFAAEAGVILLLFLGCYGLSTRWRIVGELRSLVRAKGGTATVADPTV